MDDLRDIFLNDGSRRQLLRSLGLAAAGPSFTAVNIFAQGRCRDGYGTSSCPLTEESATAPIPALFAPTGWKTAALDHITFWRSSIIKKRLAFYIALMGWTFSAAMYGRCQAVIDIG